MSAAAAGTAEKGSTYLEQLKQAAEAQMRRPAPPLPAPKKHKQSKPHSSSTAGADSGDASGGEEGGGEGAAAAAERVGRYSYAAADAVLAGCSGFIGMCDFKRSNSATKELLDMLKAVLPGEQQCTDWHSCENKPVNLSRGLGLGGTTKQLLDMLKAVLSGEQRLLSAATLGGAGLGFGDIFRCVQLQVCH